LVLLPRLQAFVDKYGTWLIKASDFFKNPQNRTEANTVETIAGELKRMLPPTPTIDGELGSYLIIAE
jgi:hypothetical protein